MNMHVPQSEQSKIEIFELASIPSQIVSPASHNPVIGINQDTLVGAYLFTKYDNYLSRSEIMDIMVDVETFDGTLPEPDIKKGTSRDTLPDWFPHHKYRLDSDDKVINDLWSGRTIFSTIIPNVNLTKSNKQAKNATEKNKFMYNVKIVNGKIINGILDSSILGKEEKALIHVIFNEFGKERTEKFMNDVNMMISNWVLKSGFSVGIGDIMPDGESSKKMLDIIADKKREVNVIIEHVHQGILENQRGKSNSEEFESKVLQTLNEIVDKTGNIGLKNLQSTNRMVSMVGSGSKGTAINICQMITSVGQLTVEGKRMPYGFTDRTLPYFTKYDDGAAARGFIENSLMRGLTPTEFFFYSIAGREGLIDTAVKSVVGETPIIIIEDNVPKYIKIGDWIDNKLSLKSEFVRHFTERQMELLDLLNEVYIPTTDENGNITWGLVTAITRHDPGTELYEIKTLGGRQVIVTESKSLLIWDKFSKKYKETLTPEIKIGDFVPVNGNLPRPPIITETIDMSTYFPKEKFLYGNEFIKACKLINEEMIGKKKIPSGWWEINNGKNFILPYTKKARIQRAINMKRSDVIKENCIYPYNSTRNCGNIPDKFVLNYENGLFIGLFLAEGHVNINGGTVSITNNNINIQKFVSEWFEKLNIKYNIKSYTNKIGGLTTMTTGYSIILGKFLIKILGHLSFNKYVPDFAFTASDEFIYGLLNGYFSGDGTVSKNSIEAGSSSYRLIEGINMLCSRIGVFGKIFKTRTKKNNLGTKNIRESHRVSIRGQWAKIFSEKINFIDDIKNEKLKKIKCSEKHRNFPTVNDTILDEIIEINIIDVSKYPKVYDLTIPTTLNFGLSNGLQVRDTSESGYLQRKLVKGMEDARIATDYTVRNANNTIIQFLYGEDGVDGSKIERQKLFTLSSDFNKAEQMRDAFYLTPEDDLSAILDPTVLSEIEKTDSEYMRNLFDQHYQSLIDDKRYVIVEIKKHEFHEGDTDVCCPINLDRLIETAKNNFVKKDVISDLNPVYVLETISKIEDKIVIRDGYKGNGILNAMIRAYLSPKYLIKKHNMNRLGFDYISSHILQQFQKSIASPGELVGTIAAQSIGEKTTQLTLNTFHFSGISAKSQVTQGLPRLKEILNLSPTIKSPSATIVLKDEYAIEKDKANTILQKIIITNIKDIIISSEIYFDKLASQSMTSCNSDDDKFLDIYRVFSDLYTTPSDAKRNPWVLRIKLDKRKLIDKKIQMIDIYHAITTKFNIDKEDISCIFTDDNSGDLIMRIQTFNTTEDIDGTDEEDMISVLRTIEQTILNEIVLTGIKGISSGALLTPSEKPNVKFNVLSNDFESKPQWSIVTTGSNLEDILIHPAIDPYRTISNDIIEVYNTLGIEAARNVIAHEIYEVLQGAGAYVNTRHIMLLADTMTNRGNLMAIDRHGIKKSDRGPLAKSSFEETPDVIYKAAIFAELDKLNGVSANIMVGQEVPIGTGAVDVVFDEKIYQKYIQELDDEIIPEQTTEKSAESKFAEEYCKSSNFTDF